jgi:hypothetical protein
MPYIDDFTRGKFEYISDDGTTYQVSERTAYAAVLGASALPAATGPLLTLPKGTVPRHVWVEGTITFGAGTKKERRKICFNGAPPAPGTTVHFDNNDWLVRGFVGEKRRDIA